MDPIVLYQDNHLIAVFKPAGVLTQGDRSGDPCLIDEVKAFIARTHGKPGRVFLGLVHRLDKPVAGVIVFARTSKAAGRLSEAFRRRELTKVYRAKVEGELRGSGELVHFMSSDDGRVAVHDEPGPGRKEARLRYRTLGRAGAHSLVEITLLTGRKHQIRAQLARIGHPIAGDRLYGARTRAKDGAIALYAQRIAFKHPVGGREMLIELPHELAPFR